MKTKQEKRPYGVVSMLEKATGYSRVYCEKVLSGERSHTSKGGKIIMEKYKELQKVLSKESVTINS